MCSGCFSAFCALLGHVGDTDWLNRHKWQVYVNYCISAFLITVPSSSKIQNIILRKSLFRVLWLCFVVAPLASVGFLLINSMGVNMCGDAFTKQSVP